ncbi:MAG: ShlB/FhaC/HecB family hemolysin secretion/activation protein [Magnetococcales bacterium]|nr:ShlB/FhaC/HecB family hemolysin secretion/activation protein [Magnetococcales bacterium]
MTKKQSHCLSICMILGLLLVDDIQLWAAAGDGEEATVVENRGKRRIKRGGAQPTEPSAAEKLPTPPLNMAPIAVPTQSPLPSLAEPQQGEPLSVMQRLLVREVRIEGNTVLSDVEAQALVAPWLNRELAIEDLLQLKDEVTRWYVERGYVTSGATLPDQQVSDGVIRLQVVEGVLSDVEISGNTNLRSRYISERLPSSPQQVLNIRDLEEQFQILRQKEMIEQLHAELRPGPTLGQAVMAVRVEERRPWQVWAGYNNQGSPNMGAQRLSVGATHRSVLGWGDQLEGEVLHSKGEDHYAVSYTMPLVGLGLPDSALFLKSGHSGSSVVVTPFDAINISGNSRTHAMGLRHALWKTTADEALLSLSFQHRDSQTFLMGAPYRFTPSDPEARTIINSLNFAQEWHHRDQQQALSLLSTFSKGVPNESGSRFWAWLGQAQWARQLPFLTSSLLTRLAYRWASEPMVATEKFTLGGMNTVRGYREGLVSRDRGVLANFEWRVPTPLKLPVPFISDPNNDGALTVALFSDMGKNWDKGQKHADLPNLASVGVGLLWDINRDSNVAIYFAEAMRNVHHNNEDIQDRGVHFRLTVAPF